MADEVFMRDFREFLNGARCRAFASSANMWHGVVAGACHADPFSVCVITDDGAIIITSAGMIVLDAPKGVLAAITGKEYK